MKRVVLISVGQPSTNPRLIKEANILRENGFDVSVVYSFWSKWAWEADKTILAEVDWAPIMAGGSPFEHQLLYLFTRLRVKFFRFVARNVTFKFGIAEIARGRTYPELLKKAMAIKADLYIAHIQAALPAAVKAAKKHHAKCGFDAEDFHRNEVDDDPNSYIFSISKFIEDKYLPLADYVTAASPLISAAYKKLYPELKNITINNCFNADSSVAVPRKNNGKLKLFWFSQTIGPDRGLEDVIAALRELNDPSIELHLLGNASNQVSNDFTAQLKGKLFIHEPVYPDQIIPFASQFDIGLALEVKTPLNRNICLTNKIFTYLQSGLAVITSDTLAQQAFMEQYPGIGRIYEGGNIRSLSGVISAFNQNRELLLEARQNALTLGREQLNWQQESKKFIQLVEQTLISD